MHRDAAPTWFRSLGCAALAAAALTVVPAIAQSDRLQQVVQQALAALDDPSRAADAATRLENLGGAAVPALREVLHYQHRQRWTAVQRHQAIYVLGRLGAHALPALPELCDVLRADEELGQQAMWSLSMLAPWCDSDQRAALLANLKVAAARRSIEAAVLHGALGLGREAAADELEGWIAGRDDTATVAACRWLVARPEAHPEQRPRLLAALDNRLERVAARSPVRWRGSLPGNFVAGDLAEAWLLVSREPLTALPARALLDHWHFDRRRAAIAWMHDHGASLPFREFADLVGRLWDTDASLVAAAADACANAKDRALVALPALRAMERAADPKARRACGAAADAIIEALRTLPAPDHAWLAAIDALLRGQPAVRPAAPCGPLVLARLTEVLWLAQWSDGTTLNAVLELAEQAGPVRDDAVQAVLGWLDRDDCRVTDVACAFLARRGAAVRLALEDGITVESPDAALRRFVRFQLLESGRRSGIELLAHATVAGTVSADLEQLLTDDNARVVAHALATNIEKPSGALRGQEVRLRALLADAAEPVLLLSGGVRDKGLRLPVDLSAQVRTLAAMALVDLDAEFAAPPTLDDAVRQTLGVPLAELDRHVAGWRERHDLPKILDRIEDQCRHALVVPAHLRWRSFRDATR